MTKLNFKYGKRKYFCIDIYKLVSLATKESMSQVKRMFDNGGVEMWLETDREVIKRSTDANS